MMAASDWAPSVGHIVRASVPYSDIEKTKTRYPVVVSSYDFNKKHQEVIVAFATRSGNIKQPQDYDVEISRSHKSFKETGLTQSTTVRCGRLWTINKKSIEDVIGIVPSDLLVDIENLVLANFGKPA